MSEQKKTTGKRQAARSKKTKRKQGTTIGVVLLIFAIVVGAIAFCGYTVYQLTMGTTILNGVRMGTVDLSDMDRQQARAALEEQYGGAVVGEVINIHVGGKDFSLSAEESGLQYDISDSVELAYAYGRDGTMMERAKLYWGTRRNPVQLELKTALDVGVLRNRVEEIAAELEQPMAPSSYSYQDGQIYLDKGQIGYSLDKEDLQAKLEHKLRTADFTGVEGVLKESHPQSLSAASIAQAVNVEVTQTTLDLEADPTGGTIRPGTAGVKVEESALNAAIASANRKETVACTLTQPDYTVSEYKALLFRDVLGEHTSDFNPGNVGRTTNVLLATDFCNGVILMPGDIFSYNDTVGPRTYERGFKDATVYVGNSAEDGVGGGICQVSSTIYYATLRADLEIVERYAHSRMVTYVPLGADATVAWGSKDFRFANNTDFPIKVVTSHKTNTLTVQLFGTDLENKSAEVEYTVLTHTPFEIIYELDETLPLGTEKVKSGGYTGYKVELYRIVYIDGVEVSRTKENTSTYKKYDKVILHNPAPEPEPLPEPVVPAPTPDPVVPAPTPDPVVPAPTPPVEPVVPAEPVNP